MVTHVAIDGQGSDSETWTLYTQRDRNSMEKLYGCRDNLPAGRFLLSPIEIPIGAIFLSLIYEYIL
jgi:hypothetical protein